MTTSQPSRTGDRRREILDAAGHLLRQSGWHSVGIDEIGAAAGLTGPAIYRYFDSKQALLTAAMRQAGDELWGSIPPDPEPCLSDYVESHVGFTLDHVDLVELWYQESRHFLPEDRADQRRLQRRYLELWVVALTDERPELDTESARMMVRAAIGLIHSVAHATPKLARRRIHAALTDMALSALATSVTPRKERP